MEQLFVSPELEDEGLRGSLFDAVLQGMTKGPKKLLLQDPLSLFFFNFVNIALKWNNIDYLHCKGS